MDSETSATPLFELSWHRSDVEQRLGFRGNRFTSVNNLLSFLIGVGLTAFFYMAIYPVGSGAPALILRLKTMFMDRGVVPYFIVFFTSWSLAILFLKWQKLRLQRLALTQDLVPTANDFILSPATAEHVIERMHEIADDPRQFLLFNRVMIALSNLRNLGRISDVDEILRSQASHEESSMETSYSLLRGFIWAIPVLGFIGTVLGLSSAIGGFGEVLGQADDVSRIAASLKGVTGGLATAFETTLEALVAALILQILVTFLKKSEEEFLDQCSEYCLRRVVNKLRIMPFERESVV